MKSLFKKALQTLAVIPVIALGVAAVAPMSVSAACDSSQLTISSGADCAQGTGQPTELFGNDGIFTKVVNILLYIIGAVAVIMLIIGGIRYVVSGGDQAAVTAAKNTIMYAIVGIVVAVLAYAAVNFVINGIVETP